MVKKKVKRNYIYEVRAQGEYYAQFGKLKETRPFQLVLQLDQSAYNAGFLSVIRNNILDNKACQPALQAAFPGWRRRRTCEITSAINITDKNAQVSSLRMMNRKQIINYINHTGSEIDPDLYPELSELRQAVQDEAEAPEQFLKNQDKRREVKGPQIAVHQSVHRLNPWLTDPTKNPNHTVPTLGESVFENPELAKALLGAEGAAKLENTPQTQPTTPNSKMTETGDLTDQDGYLLDDSDAPSDNDPNDPQMVIRIPDIDNARDRKAILADLDDL